MKTRMSPIILLLLTFVLIGCQPQGLPVPSDPLEAVKTIADKQKEVKSQHTDLALNLAVKLSGMSAGDNQQTAQALALLKNFKANATLSGDVDNVKNDAALKGEADLGPLTALIANGEDKLTFELVKVGDKLYTKAAGDTQWNVQNSSPASTDKQGNNPLGPDQIIALLKKSTKAEKLADEKIGDADTYHYKITLNPIDLITSIADMAKSNGNDVKIDPAELDQAKQLLKDSVIEVELWAGKQDLYLRQLNFHMNLNLTNIPDQPGASALIDLTVNNKASQINQPVTITAPQ